MFINIIAAETTTMANVMASLMPGRAILLYNISNPIMLKMNATGIIGSIYLPNIVISAEGPSIFATHNAHIVMNIKPKDDVIKYSYDNNDLEKCIQEVGRGYKIQRYKGLGEMNPEQLWDTTLNPKTRSLIKVTIDDAANAERMISILMGDDIEARKKYINENANFNKIDDYEKYGA
jgi:hypothetical protein